MIQRFDRWVVLKIKKTGGSTELVDVYDSQRAADAEAHRLAFIHDNYRFTAIPAVVETEELP